MGVHKDLCQGIEGSVGGIYESWRRWSVKVKNEEKTQRENKFMFHLLNSDQLCVCLCVCMCIS